MSDRKRFTAAIVVYKLIKKKHEILKMKRKKQLWVRNWIAKRYEEGVHAKLLKEIGVEDTISYENFIRMSKTCFDDLLEKITPRIKKKDTRLRKAISPSERLTLTLRFLATGKWFIIIIKY